MTSVKYDNGLTIKEMEIAEAVIAKEADGKTFEEIAQEFNMSRRHMQTIRAKKEFKEYVKERTIDIAKDSRGKVLKALEKKALSGNVKAMEVFLRVTDSFPSDKVEIKQDVQTSRDRSNDDLERDLEDLKILLDRAKDEDHIN